jgi:hypothetical protein
MRIGKAKDIHSRRPYLKVAIVGASGSGKTHWSSRSPKPLILSTEPQSLATAVEANPEATVIQIDSWQDFRTVWNAMRLAKLVECEVTRDDGTVELQPACEAVIEGHTVTYQTAIVDSFTDLQRMMLSKLAGTEDGTKDRLDFDSGAVNLSIEKWGMLTSACESIWSQQRALACNTIFLFVANDIQDEMGAKSTIPMLSGSKLPHVMGQYFNAVGLQYSRPGSEGRLTYMTRFAMPTSKAIAKGAPGWPPYVIHSTEPGKTTLGSLLRYSYPDLVVASEPHDDACFVASSLPETEQTEQTEQPETTQPKATTTRRRRS